MSAPRPPHPPQSNESDEPQGMDRRLFFSGTNLQQAVLAAARHFGVDADRIAYRRREKSSGFVKGPRVVIEVDPAAPTNRGDANLAGAATERAPQRARSAQPAAPAPSPPRRGEREQRPRPDRGGERRPPRRDVERSAGAPPPRRRPAPAPAGAARPSADAPAPQRSPAEVSEGLGEAARRLLDLTGLRLAVDLEPEGHGWRLLLRGAAEARLAGDRRLREAFEHLLPRLLRGLIGVTAGVRVVVGARDSAREDELRRLAEETAREVRETGRAVVLPEMNSFERRVVHVTLAEASGVVTESEGEGANRRVVIRPGVRGPGDQT